MAKSVSVTRNTAGGSESAGRFRLLEPHPAATSIALVVTTTAMTGAWRAAASGRLAGGVRGRCHDPVSAATTGVLTCSRDEGGKNLSGHVANEETMHLSAAQEASAAVPRVYPRRPVSRVVGQADGVRHDDSAAWLAALRGPDAVREEALAELHALLLRGARYELNRRRHALGHVSHDELRRPRDAGGGRRARRHPRQARQLPRRKPVHHLGVQVRAARGWRQGASAGVARPRGRPRRRRLDGRPRRGPFGPARSSRAASCCARSARPCRPR